MCLILFAYHTHPEYKLILAANRDEFYQRPTAPAAYWEDRSPILGGRDMEAMGTWMAINAENGKLSMLTNYRDPANIKSEAPSRGALVADYLDSSHTAQEYVQSIPRPEAYNGFNLLLGSADELWYHSNQFHGARKLPKGNYGLSNHLLNTTWPKVVQGKKKLHEHMMNGQIASIDLLNMMYDEFRAEDRHLPDTGVGLEVERALSPMFIKSPGYGTRCSTVLLIDRKNKVHFAERTYDTDTFAYEDKTFDFKLKKS